MAKDSERGDSDHIIGTLGELLQRAAHHVNEGQFSAAATICDAIIANDPKNAEAYHILGHTRARTRNNDRAIGCFMRAVTLAPTNPKFCRSFAESLENSGRVEQAMHAWSQYITLTPDDADATRRLGSLQLRQGELQQAAVTFRQAVDLAPEDAFTRYYLGLALYRTAQYLDAAGQFQTALSCETAPNNWAECHNALSATLRECHRVGDAIAHARQAIAISPELASAHNNLGLALLDQNDVSDALASLQTAVRLRPDDPETLNNLGVVLAETGHIDAAEPHFQRALTLRPGWADAHLNLANALRQAEQLEAAMAHYRAALDASPDDFRIHGSLALALQNLDQPENAIKSYERALALAPDNPELLKGLGIAQLWIGNFQDGWRNYEWRRHCRDFPRRGFQSPQWNGERLNGGRLLVHAEQGFGDTLQFCRYLPMLAEHCGAGEIIFECQRPLVDLMRSLAGHYTIVARGDTLPPADAHVALMSLPMFFKTELDTIPATVPYLAAPGEKATLWRGRQKVSDKPKIGLVWAGNPLRQDDRMRSCPLESLMPLLKHRDIELFSLQMDAGRADARWIAERGVTDWSKYISSFTDTAEAISALDLIVSVDTATAHLAGALGKPVWVLLGKAADWRYLRDRSDSPWYPSMTLFRQDQHGHWEEMIHRLCKRLSADILP